MLSWLKVTDNTTMDSGNMRHNNLPFGIQTIHTCTAQYNPQNSESYKNITALTEPFINSSLLQNTLGILSGPNWLSAQNTSVKAIFNYTHTNGSCRLQSSLFTQQYT